MRGRQLLKLLPPSGRDLCKDWPHPLSPSRHSTRWETQCVWSQDSQHRHRLRRRGQVRVTASDVALDFWFEIFVIQLEYSGTKCYWWNHRKACGHVLDSLLAPRTTFIQIGLQSDSSIRMILARSFKKCTKARDTILLGKSSTTRLVLLLFAETKTSTLKLLVVLITRQL